MRVISFKNTALFKRGIWLSAAALIVFVVAPSVLDGGLVRDPTPHLFAVCLLCAFFVYFLRKTQVHRLADEVMDCEDHLKIRRGPTEETIALATLSAAEVFTSSGIHRITLRLGESTALGNPIEFLPQASLWSNLPAVQRLASSLTERAKQAQGRGQKMGPRTGGGVARGGLTH
jgi:hypothetical protein